MPFTYKGLTAELKRIPVGEEDVDREIDALLAQNPGYEKDDKFAREVYGAENMEEVRKQLMAGLRAYYDNKAELELQDALLRKAADSLDFTPTEEQLSRAVEDSLETLKAGLAQKGVTYENYCKMIGKSDEQVRLSLRPEAEKNLRILTTVGKIGGLEGIEPTEEEIEDACNEICARNHISPEQLEAAYDEAFAAAIFRTVLVRKVLHFIRENAVVTEQKLN